MSQVDRLTSSTFTSVAKRKINDNFEVIDNAISDNKSKVEELEALVEGLQEQVGLLMEVSERKDAEVDRLREQTTKLEEHLIDVMKWAFTRIQAGSRDEHEYLVNKPEFDQWLADYDYSRGGGLSRQQKTVYDDEIAEMQRKARAVLGELSRENDYYTDFEDIVEQIENDLDLQQELADQLAQPKGYDYDADGSPRLRDSMG